MSKEVMKLRIADMTKKRLLVLHGLHDRKNCLSIVYKQIKSVYLILRIFANTFLYCVHRPTFPFPPNFRMNESLYIWFDNRLVFATGFGHNFLL